VAMGLGLTVDVPGARPDRWGNRLHQSGSAHVCCEEGAGEGGERCDRDTAVGAGGPPRGAVRGEAPARHAGVEVGVGLQLPAPGMQDPGEPGEVCPDKARVCGQPLAGHGGRLEHGLGREALLRADKGTQGRRDGAGAEAVWSRELLVPVVREPLSSFLRVALRTVAMATGRLDAGWPPTGVARREAVAGRAALALLDGAEDLAVGGGERGRAFQGLRGKGGEERAPGGQGRSPGRRGLRRSAASACPVWVRCQETSVVSRGVCPRERCMRRGCTPAARSWVAEECRRGWMAPPIVVRPARCVAVRQAPWTLLRLMGEVAGGLWR
jgi:hypothetical protein